MTNDWLNRYWIVNDDTGRFWSPAANVYVTELPEGWFLTAQDAVEAAGGAEIADYLHVVPRSPSEAELTAMLRPHGLRGPLAEPVDIKAEAQRRIIALTGAADLNGCLVKQLNATMRANELNDKRIGGAQLTEDEEAEAAGLRALAAGIKAIRARSDAIEALSPIPADFDADQRWA